jgi:hypothetical protein
VAREFLEVDKIVMGTIFFGKRLSALTPKQKTWAIRLIAFLFVVLCTNTLRHLGGPHPFHLHVLEGFVVSLMLNSPLLFSSFLVNARVKRWWRYSAGIALIPCAFGVCFVLTDYHLVLSALALLLHFLLITSLFTKEGAT